MTPQLTLTAGFGDDVDRRKEEIHRLQRYAQTLINDWREAFGHDTPVPIDRAYHNLHCGLEAVQHPERAVGRIETAREQLASATHLLATEGVEPAVSTDTIRQDTVRRGEAYV